ncbi:MAG: RDD family protein [bacterium]
MPQPPAWDATEFREPQHYSPPPEPSAPGQLTSRLEVASFGARVGAFIIDFIILRFVLFIALRLTDLDSEFQFKTPDEFDRFFKDYMSAVFSNDPSRIFSGTVGEFLQHSMTIALLTGAIFLAYYWIFHAMGGQTPGKFALGIRVCRADGRPIGWGASLLRYIVYWLGSKVLYLGSLWGMFRPDVATWHDLAAGTRVYRIKTPEPAQHPPQTGR